jgi:hypothetical protein
VWDQAFPNERQLNGALKTRSFHEEYGFKLRSVADEYRVGIKCLSNAEHADRFYQSLERGNLEKTVFVEKDGKENPYYVTPNIPVGYLEVYANCSPHAKPLTPEQLADKGFVSQEFALKVRERINQMETNKQTQKHSSVPEKDSVGSNTTVQNKKQETISKANKSKEKLGGGAEKPKRKLKPRHT